MAPRVVSALVACMVLCACVCVGAADVRGRLMVADPGAARVSLGGGQYTGIVRRDGVFVLHGVRPGVYMLDVYSKRHVFSRARVTVQKSGKVHAVEFPYPGAAKVPTSYPLVLKPQAVPVYFPARPVFNPLSYLKNPMVIIMLVAGGMMLLPKLMGEEAMEEMKKQQEEMNQSGGLAGALGLGGAAQEADDDESSDEDDGNAEVMFGSRPAKAPKGRAAPQRSVAASGSGQQRRKMRAKH